MHHSGDSTASALQVGRGAVHDLRDRGCEPGLVVTHREVLQPGGIDLLAVRKLVSATSQADRARQLRKELVGFVRVEAAGRP